MKIVFIGAVQFSLKAFSRLIELGADISGVVTQRSASGNADFADLSGLCRRRKIPCRRVVDVNEPETVRWIQKLAPDIIFCFGFSQILNKEILRIAPRGVLGFHPAQLPLNRGRHPLIWALALGLTQTASTFFFLNEKADAGDIVSQKKVLIRYTDDAQSLYVKITAVALKQIEELLPRLIRNSVKRIPQDHRRATYWRRRTYRDGMIDFRMSSRAIYDLVRALTKPYVGAHVMYKDKEVKVWQVKEAPSVAANIEYGKIISTAGRRIVVKAADGAVILVRHDFRKMPQAGEYV